LRKFWAMRQSDLELYIGGHWKTPPLAHTERSGSHTQHIRGLFAGEHSQRPRVVEARQNRSLRRQRPGRLPRSRPAESAQGGGAIVNDR
jgi:hypothetical protein